MVPIQPEPTENQAVMEEIQEVVEELACERPSMLKWVPLSDEELEKLKWKERKSISKVITPVNRR